MGSIGAPQNLLVWAAYVLLIAAGYTSFGEIAARTLCRTSLLRARLPEVAFLIGLAAWALAAYALLPFTISAMGILPGIALLALALWLYRPPATEPLPGFLTAYLDFRRTSAFRWAAGLAILLCVAASAYRMGWLLEFRSPAGELYSGTPIWDDTRTLGVPISLAAYGFPVRSPIALGMYFAYPLGAFTAPAGWLAWMPATSTLALLLADITCQAAFYVIAMLVAAGALLVTSRARLLLAASAFLSVAFNLWNLHPSENAWWLNHYFGYFRINLLQSTIAWTPLSGLVWIGNHALGFAALVLAALWVREPRVSRHAAILLVAFSAASSMDITAMALSATCPLLLWAFVCKRLPMDQIRWGVGLCALALSLLILVNLPTLSGAVDSPFDPIFPFTSKVSYNVGVFFSTTGGYWLVLLTGMVVLALRERRLLASWWWFPVLTGVAFSFLFEYHTIWFWRFSFTAHLLLGLLCALHLEAVKGHRAAARAITMLWVAALLPGLYQSSVEASHSIEYGAWVSPPRAEAAQWIHRNTALSVRVATYRAEEASWATDINLLRAGSRAGLRVYDRSHPLIGYEDYLEKMQTLGAGIAANDLLLTPTTDPLWRRALEACNANRRFSNTEFTIYEVTSECRKRVEGGDLSPLLRAIDRRDRLPLLLSQRGSAEKLPVDMLAEWVILHPEKMHLLRAAIEPLWASARHKEAAALLEPVVEAHPQLAEAQYSLAFSLHVTALDPLRAIEHYNAALRAGYDEFWSRFNRGAAYALTRQYAPALADLERAYALKPHHPGLVGLIARTRAEARSLQPR
jgi:tetratricopeptide (TPR) repeat protein